MGLVLIPFESSIILQILNSPLPKTNTNKNTRRKPFSLKAFFFHRLRIAFFFFFLIQICLLQKMKSPRLYGQGSQADFILWRHCWKISHSSESHWIVHPNTGEPIFITKTLHASTTAVIQAKYTIKCWFLLITA